MFLEHGFGGARIAEIAARARVAEGTIYLYFRNKAALLHAVVSGFYTRLTASARDGIADVADTRGRLAFLARHHVSCCLAEWRILELAIVTYRGTPDYEVSGYRQFNKTYVGVFDDVIRDGVNRGDLRGDLPLPRLRDLFYGGLEYACRTHLLRGRDAGDENEITALSAQVVDLVWRGAAAPAAAAVDQPGLAAIVRRLERVAERLDT